MRLPAVTVETWPAFRARALPVWQPALDELRLRWGLSGEFERLPGGEDSAAFAVGELVVKLSPPGSTRWVDKEVRLLGRVGGQLPVPVPRVVERHDEDGWIVLLLTRIPGVLAETAWPSLTEEEREAVLRELGGIMRAFREVPSESDAGVLLHGDLTGENVLLETRDGRWRANVGQIAVVSKRARAGRTAHGAEARVHGDRAGLRRNHI